MGPVKTKISQALSAFYQSSKGIAKKKQISARLREFYDSSEGMNRRAEISAQGKTRKPTEAHRAKTSKSVKAAWNRRKGL